jgi:hypothetical protein
MQTFFQDGDQEINGDSTPDLGADGVGRGAVKGFDAQMLLEPFEKQLDLPAAPIQLGDGQGRHGEVVGEENQPLAGLGIAKANAPQRGGIIVLGFWACRHHGLIETQASGFIHGPGVAAGATEVFLGTGDKESAGLMEPVEPGEIEIPTVQKVESARFPCQLVEDVQVLNTARGDNDDGGKVALQCQQRVQFDARLVSPEGGPGKEREAQVNGSGVQRVGRGLKFNAEGFIGVEDGGLLNEDLGKVGENTPVAAFISVGQGAAGRGLPDPGVIEFGAKGGQAGFDIAQAFPPGQLGESQHQEMFISREFADTEVAIITGDALVEFVFGQEVHKLGEDGATFVHKVENRGNAGSHLQGVVTKLKSKKNQIAKMLRFYRDKIADSKNLTGQL